jgi:hypothetical protein
VKFVICIILKDSEYGNKSRTWALWHKGIRKTNKYNKVTADGEHYRNHEQYSCRKRNVNTKELPCKDFI